MPAQKVWAPHGTVKRYHQGGCDDLRGGSPGAGVRCDECIAARSEARSRQKAGYNTPHPPKVTSMASHRASKGHGNSSNDGQNAMGPNERAWALQLEPYVDSHPGSVATALTLARVLDDPQRANTYPQITNQINAIEAKLTTTKKKKSRGRLAAVQAITR